MPQHVERQVLKGSLVVEYTCQVVHVGADLGEDILAHHLHRALRPFGDRLAGQRLAQHERQGGRQRHVVRLVGADDGVGIGPHLDCRAEIVANAGIARGADRLVADLLDRIVTGAGNRFGGRTFRV